VTVFEFDKAEGVIRRVRRKVGRLLGRGAPPAGRTRWGDLGRAGPISRKFGYDRGGPVDRHYIEAFLARHANDVRGHVLEVKDGSYTGQFGGDRVIASDVLDIDDTNPKATIIVDLNDARTLPENSFDCIILTQTLQLIFDVESATASLHRSLKPGGILLLTVPGITPVRTQTMTWYWSFTELAVARILDKEFGPQDVSVVTYGNLRSATAFLYGLGATELSPEQLAYIDLDYPVIIGARAVKPEQ
jgi:SAM-dependent methyltransferase